MPWCRPYTQPQASGLHAAGLWARPGRSARVFRWPGPAGVARWTACVWVTVRIGVAGG